MKIIEITAQPSGAHQNREVVTVATPNGWAVIPPGMPVPDTFPFVELTAENGVVTSMTAGVVPDPEPAPTPTPTAEERLEALEAAMLEMMGVTTGG